jgi:hypothetical protein
MDAFLKIAKALNEGDEDAILARAAENVVAESRGSTQPGKRWYGWPSAFATAAMMRSAGLAHSTS